jgi:hypothetical protein
MEPGVDTGGALPECPADADACSTSSSGDELTPGAVAALDDGGADAAAPRDADADAADTWPCGPGAPYSSRQFDRSSSYTSMARDIELSSLGGGGGGGGGDAAGARDTGAGAWAAFEVAEPSTETAFLMRGLKDALTKKARGAAGSWACSRLCMQTRPAPPRGSAQAATPGCGRGLKAPRKGACGDGS